MSKKGLTALLSVALSISASSISAQNTNAPMIAQSACSSQAERNGLNIEEITNVQINKI